MPRIYEVQLIKYVYDALKGRESVMGIVFLGVS